MTQPSITCPRCGATSYNPHDISDGYCGRCHWWTSDSQLGQIEPPQPRQDTTRRLVVKALSLTRPWTELVLRFGKDIENRTWSTSYRGPLIIHGAKSWDNYALTLAQQLGIVDGIALAGDSPTGYLGVVTVIDVCSAGINIGGSCNCGPWAMPGQYHWRLAQPLPFVIPLPGNGMLGLFDPPDPRAVEHARSLLAAGAAS